MATGIKDVDLKIMMDMDDRTLFNFCQSNKYTNKLCSNEFFWRTRFITRFGELAGKYKPKDRLWRKHYLTVIIQLDEYSENPWDFFKKILWEVDKKISEAEIYDEDEDLVNISEAPENIHNTFWMLELGKDITIVYPVNRDNSDYIKRNYKSDINFTPGKVLQIIYDFYQEPLLFEDEEHFKRIDFIERKRFDEFYDLNEVSSDEGEVKYLSLS